MLVSAPARKRRLGLRQATRTCARRSRNTPRAPRSPRSTPRCSGGSSPSSSRAARSPIPRFSPCRRSRTSRLAADACCSSSAPTRRCRRRTPSACSTRSSQKNNFCILTGDGSDLAKLEDACGASGRSPRFADEDGGDKSPNVAGTERGGRTGRIRVQLDAHQPVQSHLLSRAAPQGRRSASSRSPLKMTPTKAKDGKSNSIDGETAIEEALASTGASKLYKEITDANVDALADARRDRCCGSPAATGAPAGRTSRSRRSATCAGRGCRPRDSTNCARRAVNTGALARQQRRLHREGTVPAGEDVSEGRDHARATTNRQGDDRPDRHQRRRQGRKSTTRRPTTSPTASPDRAGHHLRKRRDGPVVPRGRSRRQASRPAPPRSGRTR